MTDTTNETDGTLADEVTPKVELTFPAKGLAFKEHATQVLHQWADRRDYCSTFDEIMVKAGLKARPRQIDNGYASETEFAEEETQEEFDTWLQKARAEIHDGATRHGFGSQADDVFEEAGIGRRPSKVRQRVKISGTFEVETEVVIREGDDIITALPSNQVRELVWTKWGGETATWKATVVDEAVELEDDDD